MKIALVVPLCRVPYRVCASSNLLHGLARNKLGQALGSWTKKTREPHDTENALLAAIPDDGVNLGRARISDVSQGVTADQLS